MKKYNEKSEEVQSFEYYYNNTKLAKLIYADSRIKKTLFYQYKEGVPIKIIQATPPENKLLSTSDIYTDSLRRPVLLKNYDKNQILQYVQKVRYDDTNNKFFLQFDYIEHPFLKGQSSIIEYYPCSEDIYLSTIHTKQFENVETKVLNLSVENNKATILKAVHPYDKKKEEIYLQEIIFDAHENWTNSRLYRLKSRKNLLGHAKTKQILVKEIERVIVYR